MTQLALQLEPAPLSPANAEVIDHCEREFSKVLLPVSHFLPEAACGPAASSATERDRCREQPRGLGDRLTEGLDRMVRKAEEAERETRQLLADVLGIPVEKLDEHQAAEKAKEDQLRQEARASQPARAPKGKAAKGGDAIGIGRAALSDRQRQLLSHIKVENNLAVYTSPDRIPDWDLLKRIMLALGGTWKTGGKKAPGGFRFPDDLDAAELVRLAKETGEITDPKAAEFFWTSDELADVLAAFIDPKIGDEILEPSAGEGALVEAIHRLCPTCMVDCVEPLERSREVLMAMGAGVRLISQAEEDFLLLDPPRAGELYDAVIANPPFGKRADVIHITRMLDWLKPGGRLAAIASAGVKYRDDARGRAFRELIASHSGVILDNEDGAFLHAGTGVRTVRILLTKGGAR